MAMLRAVCGVPYCWVCSSSSRPSLPLIDPASSRHFWRSIVPGRGLAGPRENVSLSLCLTPSGVGAPLCCREGIFHGAPEVVHFSVWIFSHC